MTPQRAMTGPVVGFEGTHGAGATNHEVLAEIVEALGSPPVRGHLYRVVMLQGEEGNKVAFIGEYLGLVEERRYDGAGQIALLETALWFAIRNPVLPAETEYGTRENPLVLWPLDIWHLSAAQPGDLEKPMHFKVEGEESGRTPGRARIQ
jgi:hypothetical protein